jgi:hypothetical protein
MGHEYKRELMKRYGINPTARGRDWTDSEHEILALLLDDLREHCIQNDTDIAANRALLNDHHDFITSCKARSKLEGQYQDAWFKRTDIQIQIWLLVLSGLMVLQSLNVI